MRRNAAASTDERKTDQLFSDLKAAIFRGDILPGDALSESGLAKVKKVSQTTIRETLFELEGHGLVTRTPRRGTFVTNLTRIDIDERIEARAPLEALAWRKAIPRLGPEDFAELRRLAKRLESADAFELDYDFHSFLWAHAQNATLFRALDQLVTPMFGLVFLAKGTLQSRKERADSHRQIVEVLEKGDVHTIESLVHEHIDSAYRHVRHRYRDARELAIELRSSNRFTPLS